MEDMKEFLSQFCEVEQTSMMDFVDDVNHAIQYFKLLFKRVKAILGFH